MYGVIAPLQQFDTNTLVGVSCETLWWGTLGRHSYKSLVTLVHHSCGTLLQETRQSCKTLVQDTLREAQQQDTLAGDSSEDSC